ncbi:hypothetical protein M9H77_27482 [Catharanthus roseus]|uniref:Uncharacterized protein n=1 Tax=Catharanthus roseus TaxID=4058 RepID=A0ACC0AD17_CATRO|nr:hypothetical protein M9H77_27482 [Catharanthus roseus]
MALIEFMLALEKLQSLIFVSSHFHWYHYLHSSSSKTASSTTVRRWMKFFIKMWRLVELGCPRAIEWSIAPWGGSIETTMRTNLPLLIREISDIPSNIPHLIS